MTIVFTQLHTGKQVPELKVYSHTAFSVEVRGYVPPVQYQLHYRFSLADQSKQFNIIQSYSLDNIVHFTTTAAGKYTLRCEAKLVQQIPEPSYLFHKNLETPTAIIQGETQLEFTLPGTQKAPCCVPLFGTTSPVYITPQIKSS